MHGETTPTTLLAFSVSEERDMITYGLLRAGADPTMAFGAPPSILGTRVKQHLKMMNSAMAVYAVKLFCGSVLECRKEGVSNERCQRCGENDETLLRCHPCRHYCCSDCFWQRSSLKGLFEDTSCPVCDEWLSVPVQEEDGENEGTENSLGTSLPRR